MPPALVQQERLREGNDDYAGSKELQEEFWREIRQLVEEGIEKGYAESNKPRIDSHRYEIGPAAQSWPMELFLLFDPSMLPDPTSIPHFDDIANAAKAIGAIKGVTTAVVWIKKGYEKLMRRRNIDPDETPPTFAKPIIEAVCVQYIRDNHHPKAKLTSEIEAFPDPTHFSTADHPGFGEHYRVKCNVARKVYTFDVDGRLRVSSFTVKDGKHTTELALPDLTRNVPIE